MFFLQPLVFVNIILYTYTIRFTTVMTVQGGGASMLSSEPFICLDIGRALIHLMAGQAVSTDQGIDIRKVGLLPSSGFRHDVVLDPRLLSDSLREAVVMAQKDLEQPVRRFYLGVDSVLTRLKKVEAVRRFSDTEHRIDRDDVEQLMRELRYDDSLSQEYDIDLFPVIYTLDRGRVTLNPLQLTSSLLGVKGFILQRRDDTLLHILRSLRYACIKVDALLHIGMAVGEVFLSREEKQKGCVVFDLGAEGSKFYLFRSGFMQGDLFVPMGGHHFSSDIDYVLRCGFAQAEELKIRYGFRYCLTEPGGQAGAEALQPLMQRLQEESYTALAEEELGSLVSHILWARLEYLLQTARLELIAQGFPLDGFSLKLMGGEMMLSGIDEGIARLWNGEVDVLKPSLSQVALPTFTSTYAMTHYLARLYLPEAAPPDPASWIDLSSEYVSLQPDHPAAATEESFVEESSKTEAPEPQIVDDSLQKSDESNEESVSLPEKDEHFHDTEERNQRDKPRNVGWRRWFGLKGN